MPGLDPGIHVSSNLDPQALRYSDARQSHPMPHQIEKYSLNSSFNLRLKALKFSVVYEVMPQIRNRFEAKTHINKVER